MIVWMKYLMTVKNSSSQTQTNGWREEVNVKLFENSRAYRQWCTNDIIMFIFQVK